MAATAPKEKKTEKVYADYRHSCEVCGAKPVVSVTGLCGPCTFGEASCVDPAEWEGEYEVAVRPKKARMK